MQTSLAEGGVLFTLENEEGDEVSIALQQLLSRPQDEELMDQAKASGRQLFVDLAPEARKHRIDALVSKQLIVAIHFISKLNNLFMFNIEMIDYSFKKITIIMGNIY